MSRSMTAFGRARQVTPDGGRDVTVEIKSVNSRYLDCTVKLPRSLSHLEDKVKSYLGERGISRGKVEVWVSVDVLSDKNTELKLDSGAAKAYIDALRALRDEFSLRDDISVMTVAQNRDIFLTRRADDDAEKDWQDLLCSLSPAVDAFVLMRRREGDALMADILEKLRGIRKTAEKIKVVSEADIAAYPEKLTERIRQILDNFDVEIAEQRVLTEAALYADKASIDEELVRLSSHFDSFEEIASGDGPVGRKLDFLLQEINRETNTIGSKAGNLEIAKMVVDVKAELEKIREQIQNIE
ncbi:MAG: YicC family protein [Clostridia bacterium]|nr:YicC family protein [Clostridia bacterium]